MSEFHVEVVKVGPVEKHPNADTLGITKVGEYPVIVRLGETNEGDLAVYVPVDCVVPDSDPRWSFLQGKTRIKAKKLRGVFSMGLLTPADPSWTEGQNVTELMGIKKYENPEEMGLRVQGGDNEHCPFVFPRYTDIEAYRKYPNVFDESQLVVVTEKIHGTNARFVFKDGRLWAASHHAVKKDDEKCIWWSIAKKYDLEKKLSAYPDVIIYGEIYGWVQKLRYGHEMNTASLRLFDAFDMQTGQYLHWSSLNALAGRLDLDLVPILYEGLFDKEKILPMAEGQTTLGADHVREGIVIKHMYERYDPTIGRAILKHVGQGYLLSQ